MKYQQNEQRFRIPQNKGAQAKLDTINKKVKQWSLSTQQYHFEINNISIDSNDANELENVLCSNPPPIIIQIIKVCYF